MAQWQNICKHVQNPRLYCQHHKNKKLRLHLRSNCYPHPEFTLYDFHHHISDIHSFNLYSIHSKLSHLSLNIPSQNLSQTLLFLSFRMYLCAQELQIEIIFTLYLGFHHIFIYAQHYTLLIPTPPPLILEHKQSLNL